MSFNVLLQGWWLLFLVDVKTLFFLPLYADLISAAICVRENVVHIYFIPVCPARGAPQRSPRVFTSPWRDACQVERELRSHLGFLKSNHFAALQLSLPRRASADRTRRSASISDALVKSNYRRLALRFHPGWWCLRLLRMPPRFRDPCFCSS